MGGHDDDGGDHTMTISLRELLDSMGDKEASVSVALVALTGSAMGRTFRLTAPVNVIGRSDQAEIQIDEDGVSRRHAQIMRMGDKWVLTDLNSTNGTVCNGNRLTGAVELREGDRIRVAQTVLRFETTDEMAEQMRAKLYDLATRDPLTGAYNRRFLNERLASEWAWSIRHGRPCAAVAVDIDHFKRVNDTWGHPAGDFVLKETVAVMKRTIRAEDLLARVGGEEFVVFCRATDVDQALIVAERLRIGVQNHKFVWQQDTIPVTISAGVASSTSPGVSSPQSLLSLADVHLYHAKELGRNRVESE
jgi:two-component system cell cycle response regulator